MASIVNVVAAMINTYHTNVTLFPKEAITLYTSSPPETYKIYSSLATLEKHHYNLLRNFSTFLTEPQNKFYNSAYQTHLSIIADSRALIKSRLEQLRSSSKDGSLQGFCTMALGEYEYQLIILELLQERVK